MRIRPVFAWYDGYLGYYWSRGTRTLYVMVPMVGIAIKFGALTEAAAELDEHATAERGIRDLLGPAADGHDWSLSND